ncbi:hypothetical protein SEA_SCHMIDT_38 [Gordonia phage Schmidt]|uniref:Uncharacterized protein n=1 Tax=Gordonia phage Schmidt TaxID=2301697 RepID=A0A385E082_9CAUD|nr:hypothetical protein KDJ59_gp38 [Gordonia phage Schmidt]AXQ65160.1 hypothetical protein SEA_SCHMIDT_38 [Gordonia phage Schmidt]
MSQNTSVPIAVLAKALDVIHDLVADNRALMIQAQIVADVDGEDYLPEPEDQEPIVLPEVEPEEPQGYCEPVEFGTYADSEGDLWRHNAAGWQPIETRDGDSVVHLSEPCEWCESVADFAPFQLIELERDVTYSLSETAEILRRNGIETGRNRLYRYLNHGIAWTDGDGSPRAIADGYLVESEPASGSRSAVVRVTPQGVNVLIDALGVDL